MSAIDTRPGAAESMLTQFTPETVMNGRTMVVACTLCFVAGAGAMWAQQQVQSASRREPQFENDEVRAWKSIIMPKQPLTFHRHDHGRAIIALRGGRLDLVGKDGKVLRSNTWQTGKAYWYGVDPTGQMHADVNNTSKPIEVIVVELKKDKQP
jgi:beta-alanine degradation protein BauB